MSRTQPPTLSQDEINAGEQWLIELYQMTDAKDVGVIAKYCTDDVVVNLGNAPPLCGRQVVEGMYSWQFSGCDVSEHKIEDVRVLHDRVMVALSVSVSFTSGVRKRVNSFVVWHKTPASDKATRADIYGDFSEVSAELIATLGPPALG